MPPRLPSSTLARLQLRSGFSRRSTAGLVSTVEARVVLDASEGPLEGRQTFYAHSSPTTLQRMRKYEAEAGVLALEAAELARGGRRRRTRVTHLVTVSCSGFYAPGFDIGLVRDLPLPSSLARTHIGFMGCQGALNGLRVAPMPS